MKFVVVLLFALFYSSKGSGGINSVVTSIGDFQSVDVGGFQFNRYSAPTLEDTSDALFLSSLFGSTDKVNLIGVSKFVQSLRNLDGGYCDQPGSISDAVSVRNALVSLSYLGATIDEKQTAAIGSFLDSLYDSESNLFANKKGSAGDIKSTAIVFESYQRLGLGESASVVAKKTNLKKYLQSLVKTDAAGRKFFYSITADNAYAVIAASFVSFDFGVKSAWANYFENRQVQEGFWKGGFYSDSDRVDVSTQDATLSLQALSQLQGQLVSSVDVASLIAYANTLPGDLRVAAHAYKAISKSSGFSSLFKIEPNYIHREPRHRVVNHRIIQGAQVKPSLSVRSNFGISQSSLTVKVDIKHAGETRTLELVWNAEEQIYASDEFFSAENKLGAISFDYTVSWTGENSALQLTSADALSIGYWSNVKLKATNAGQEVESGVGAVVDHGASFVATATYGTVDNKPNAPLKQGPFEVIFSVTDSSNSVITETVLDGAKGKPFRFNYLLSATDIPSGVLTVKVAVKDTARNIVHTEDEYTFLVQQPHMVASDLKFTGDKTKFQIGDKVEVSMIPGNLPDIRTVQPFKKVARSLILNLQASETSDVLLTVPGVFQSSTGQYTFSFDITPTFDSIGFHSISFVYKANDGATFPLKLFNSQSNYLYDVGETFSYTVDTKLVITDDKSQLKDGQLLNYGNDVSFNFKIFDEISKKNVWAGTKEATAYLVLEHDAGKPSAFTSIKHAITQVSGNNVPTHFNTQWSVNPNALKGPAVLALIAEAADGSEISLIKDNKPWKVNVNIGGDIDVTKNSFSGKLIEFELSCQQKSLRGAQLSAIVKFKDEELEIPVATGAHGRYQVSWLLEGKVVVAGDYQINVYRQVDKKRNADALPFLSIVHTHVPPATSPLPVRTELVILLVFIGSFVWVSLKKVEIQGTKQTK